MITGIIFLSIGASLLISILLWWKNQGQITDLNTKVHKYHINKKLKDLEYNSITSILKDCDIERKKIIDELHENLGSKLVAIKFQISALNDLDEKHEHIVNKANALLDEAVVETRKLAYNITDEKHKNFDMIAALHEIKSSIEKEKNVTLGIYFHGLVQQVSSELNLQLYRVIQSLITNTLTYANASKINIQLYKREEEMVVMVEDDGIGFDPVKMKNNASGIGFKELERKLDTFNGKMFIDSMPGHGTTVTIEIPLAA